MKRFGIDIDGVLADFNLAWNSLSHATFGIPEDVTFQPEHWSFQQAYGLTETQEAHLWSLINASPDFWATMPSLPGAAEALATLSRMESFRKVDVWFVTSRPQGQATLSQTEQWLRSKGFLAPRVIIADDKGEVATILKMDYFIDDRDVNVEAVKKASPSTDVFLVNYAYNKSLWNRTDLVHVQSFAEAVALLEKSL